MAMLTKKKKFKGVPSGTSWYCPFKVSQIQAVVCGKNQEEKRKKCMAVDRGNMCPRLDYTVATEAWAEYKKGK